jgi:UDP-N-acetylglucosamine--N-acetylmuramyl-(pentapeptide) pyrophosphoryl-undecaprenol N-acetylglucosamine transferase
VVAGGGTGGHLYPGLAVARALVRLNPAVVPFFIGAKRGIERDVLPRTEFEHELLDLHPLYRRRPWQNWKTMAGAVRSWGRLKSILNELSPPVVLGCGGYASGLTLAAAWRARVPVTLQEQNSHPGLTTRMFSRVAHELYLGFPESGRYLRRGKGTRAIDTGNPIEPPQPGLRTRADLLAQWEFPSGADRVLLVMGGSQGAAPINSAVAAIVHRLNEARVFVVWATGAAHHGAYRHLESSMTRVVGFISPISDAYAVADLAICRSGAMTIAELCAWGIPSLLVPLPTAAANHQLANAHALEEAGCALMIEQKELTDEYLLSRVSAVVGDTALLEGMRQKALVRGRPDAAEVIAKRLLAISDVR